MLKTRASSHWRSSTSNRFALQQYEFYGLFSPLLCLQRGRGRVSGEWLFQRQFKRALLTLQKASTSTTPKFRLLGIAVSACFHITWSCAARPWHGMFLSTGLNVCHVAQLDSAWLKGKSGISA
eukprot:3932043-Rhodomonas_salina.4